jgi:hypothetical protein
MDDRVECYSGIEYAERPDRFYWQGKWRRVRDVRGERRLPGGKQFEVETGDGEVFFLTYDSGTDQWLVRPLS